MENFRVNEETWEYIVRDPEGPGSRYLNDKAEEVIAVAQSLIEAPDKAGELYTHGFFRREGRLYALRGGNWGRTYPHLASAPGQAPAFWMGKLLGSFFYESAGSRARAGAANEVVIGNNAPEAIWMELGTRYNEPRPFLRPALDVVIGNDNG